MILDFYQEGYLNVIITSDPSFEINPAILYSLFVPKWRFFTIAWRPAVFALNLLERIEGLFP